MSSTLLPTVDRTISTPPRPRPHRPGIELRVAWIVLGCALLVAFGGGRSWLALVTLPWLGGLLLLARRRTGTAIDDGAVRLAARTGVRIAIVVLAGLLIAVTHVLNGAAALFLLAWGGAASLAALALDAQDRLASLLQGGALALTLLTIMGAAVEALLRLPPLAESLGTPLALQAWEQRYDRLWEQNIFGFRSSHESIAKAGDTRRVIAIGDSFTWGDKVASSDSLWASRLEVLLAGSAAGSVEVVNMAQRGYTTANEAEVLRRLGWSFDPDLVLMQFLDNDALPSGPYLQRRGEDLVFPGHSLIPGRFRGDWTRTSSLVALAERYYSVLRNGGSDPRALLELYADTSAGWRQTQSALREIGQAGRSRGVPVVLIIFPRLLSGSWTPETHPMREAHAKVARAAAAAGIEVIDLTPVFAAEGGDWRRWWGTAYDAHPSAAAHALAARAIHRELSARGLTAAPAIREAVAN